MSLAEFVIAAALLLGLMGTLAIQYVYFSRSFVRMQNYMYMNGKSRYAMDRLSREIRQAVSIVSFSTNSLTIRQDSNDVTFAYSPALKTLSRRSPGRNDVYLTDCSYLRFDAFKRITASNSFLLAPATKPSLAKVVRIDWVCSKPVAGGPDTDENCQSAIVALRKW